MKSCLRNKPIFLTFFLVLLVLITCFVFAGCSFGNSNKLTDTTSGAVLEGGDFEEGSTLSVTLIQDTESPEYCQAIEAIAKQNYDTTKPVYIFDISVTNNEVKVQPNGKVKVTIPVSHDLTGYEVLHIKDDGTVERLNVTYLNGKATFETTSFSKFVFVKKISPSGSGSESGSGTGGSGTDGTGDTTTKFSFCATADRVAPPYLSQTGGCVLDATGEYITNETKMLAQGSTFTVQSLSSNADFYFVGWYEASSREEATADKLISKEPTYTFTINKNLNICAMYAYKTDAVEIRLSGSGSGFSYKNGEPVITLVTKDSTNVPNYETVYVSVLQGNGNVLECSDMQLGLQNFNDYIDVNNGGIDFSKVGSYTITYSYKQNSNIKATLDVQVVESGHTLSVSTQSNNNLQFYCNESDQVSTYTATLPQNRPVTLTATPSNNYAFTGWYNANNECVSTDLVYCFEMPNNEVTLYGKCEQSSVSLTFDVGYSEGDLVDDFGNACIWSGTQTKYFKSGETVSLTIKERSAYDFKGWYKLVGGEYILDTSNRQITLTLDENMSIKALFREKIRSIEVDSDTLLENGFANGKLPVTIGDTAVEYTKFKVSARGARYGYLQELNSDDYEISGSVNYTTAGTYTITYTYKYDTKFKTSLQIVVVDPSTPTITFEKGASYLDHEYNGKATFISLRDVKLNGTPLYEFRSDSKIWDKISYKWIDTTTNQEVVTTGADITINGIVNKKFGPSSDPFTVGNEFGGPIQAGSYRFEFYYDGEKQFTQNSTISTHTYTKITTSNEFQTAEGSTWVNFELYYHTIVGVVDGEYYVMQMPSIRNSDENVSVEARKVTPNADGSISLGGGNDFAFVNMKYYANDPAGYTEFLTGYYGSYVIRSSNNTADGTIWGTPYIYRTGYTSFSDGKIYRDYGDKSFYGNKTIFDENGAVTIYSIQSSSNNKLRLVKDGDKYVFTTVAQEGDDRPSYDVFLYRSVLDTNDVQDDSKK